MKEHERAMVSRFLRSQLRRIGPGNPRGRDPLRTPVSANQPLQRQTILGVSLYDHCARQWTYRSPLRR